MTYQHQAARSWQQVESPVVIPHQIQPSPGLATPRLAAPPARSAWEQRLPEKPAASPVPIAATSAYTSLADIARRKKPSSSDSSTKTSSSKKRSPASAPLQPVFDPGWTDAGPAQQGPQYSRGGRAVPVVADQWGSTSYSVSVPASVDGQDPYDGW